MFVSRQSIETHPSVLFPRIQRGKLPGGNPRAPSLQWYGAVEGADIPDMQFQFPLDIDLEEAFKFFHPDHFSPVFIGRISEWPREESRAGMQLLMADGYAQRSMVAVGSPYLGMFATVITATVIHAGRQIRPKYYLDPSALKNLDLIFVDVREHVWGVRRVCSV